MGGWRLRRLGRGLAGRGRRGLLRRCAGAWHRRLVGRRCGWNGRPQPRHDGRRVDALGVCNGGTGHKGPESRLPEDCSHHDGSRSVGREGWNHYGANHRARSVGQHRQAGRLQGTKVPPCRSASESVAHAHGHAALQAACGRRPCAKARWTSPWAHAPGLPPGEFVVETLMPITMVPVVRKGNPLARATSLRELARRTGCTPAPHPTRVTPKTLFDCTAWPPRPPAHWSTPPWACCPSWPAASAWACCPSRSPPTPSQASTWTPSGSKKAPWA